MREMLCRLGSFCHVASKAYREAAGNFGKNREFKSFINGLARSEKRLAVALLESAERLEMAGGRGLRLLEELESSKDLVEQSYAFFRSSVFPHEDAFLEGLLQCEYLKWNCLVSPLAEGLASGPPEAAALLAASQRHKRRIDRFVESVGHSSPGSFRLRASRPVWVERLLLVGEFDPEVVSALEAEGKVDLAGHGRDAVDMLSERYYALVLSDTALPHLDGIEFCKKASRKYPGIEERFLFMYDSLTARDRDFIVRKGIRHLKRTRPEKVRSEAVRVLER